MIPVFCCNTKTMVFRQTLICCPKCNRHDRNLDDVKENEIRLPYGQTEEMVRQLGYKTEEEVRVYAKSQPPKVAFG
jgi:hypothetical protein